MPVQQERQTVTRQVSRAGGEHCRTVTGVQNVVAVARYHIEERARKVAFVSVVRLIYRAAYAGFG